MAILIVEDNPITSKMLQYNLQKQGYETIAAYTGTEALEYLDTVPDVQLILTDIIMPGMNGLDFLRKIKQRPELKEIPVILCTAIKEKEFVQKAAELGCTHYMTKPLNLESLLRKTAKILKKEKSILQDKNKIRLRLLLDYDRYKALDAMFSTLILDKIMLIEDHSQRGFTEDISDSVLQLLEGATLLGADRLKTELQRLEAKKKADDESAMKNAYPRILRELKSLKDHLITKPQVTIRYELPEDSRVTLFVHDPSGNLVRRLVDEVKRPGVYEITWNGCDDAGTRLESGLYHIHLKAGSNVQERSFHLD